MHYNVSSNFKGIDHRLGKGTLFKTVENNILDRGLTSNLLKQTYWHWPAQAKDFQRL